MQLGSLEKSFQLVGIIGLVSLFLITFLVRDSTTLPVWRTSSPNTGDHLVNTIESLTGYFFDYTLRDADFGEMGRRTEILAELIQLNSSLSTTRSLTSLQKETISNRTAELALSLFPFLPEQNPVEAISQNIQIGSKGIVIPVGLNTFRYACHLITCLRNVLHSTLPIQVAYAGETDLPVHYREFIRSLAPDISTLDIFSIFDPQSTFFKSEKGGWWIKPFALLASPFQHVLLLDADAVFVQPPETIFDTHEGYLDTGILLFHDRLLWQGGFPDRHTWWEAQLKHTSPSATLNKSLVYNEDYAEECDSGVIALDKGRLGVLVGLLHIAWQNTNSPRRNWLEKLTYGDKESWWFGFELVGTAYSFEQTYGSIVGSTYERNETFPSEGQVCSFVIAHVDQIGKLLWYNGSLLKNKIMQPLEFEVPTHRIVEGVWHKGARKADVSCMVGQIEELSENEIWILSESVKSAEEVDHKLRQEFPRRFALGRP